MSWVTVIWSIVASACLTLAAIYFLVWYKNRYKNRSAWAHLLFSVTAASTTGIAFCELSMMRAQTPADLVAAMNFYPADTRNHRLNLQIINVNRSTVSSSFGCYIGGQDGTSFAAGFSVFS